MKRMMCAKILTKHKIKYKPCQKELRESTEDIWRRSVISLYAIYRSKTLEDLSGRTIV
jgi:uncharacterized protein YlxP (DUF503 family)